jgi:hypothetical protein
MHARKVEAHEGGSAGLLASETGIFVGRVDDVPLIRVDATIGISITNPRKGNDVGLSTS